MTRPHRTRTPRTGALAESDDPREIQAELEAAETDVETLRVRVAAGTVNAGALALAQYRVAGIRRRLAQLEDGPDAA